MIRGVLRVSGEPQLRLFPVASLRGRMEAEYIWRVQAQSLRVEMGSHRSNCVGLANIREEVTIGHGKQSYSGSFTLDQSDTNGDVLVHLAGNVSAERITAD